MTHAHVNMRTAVLIQALVVCAEWFVKRSDGSLVQCSLLL